LYEKIAIKKNNINDENSKNIGKMSNKYHKLPNNSLYFKKDFIAKIMKIRIINSFPTKNILISV
jgi:hypothetical protein